MVSRSILRQQKEQDIQVASEAAAAISNDHPDVTEKIEALQNAHGRNAEHTEAAKIKAMSELIVAIRDATVGEDAQGEPTRLEDLDSLNKGHVDALKGKGISDIDFLRSREDEELESIPGIGKGTVEKIRAEIGYDRDED